VKDAGATAKALQAGRITSTVVGNENRLRLSVSVFNNDEDIDRVVDVFRSRRSFSAGQ
jgi:selenocysteine lyase/cysteine desulfurase